MKIRTGFVSNSSSSSFALIGTRVLVDDLKESDMSEDLWVVGPSLGEGQFLMRLSYPSTLEWFQFIKKHPEHFTAFSRAICVWEGANEQKDFASFCNRGAVDTYCGKADHHLPTPEEMEKGYFS
jgi:hypothetical protein